MGGGSFQLPTVTAHNIGGDRWEMRAFDGFPSHCASATYAVYARLVAVLQNSGSINLSGEQILSQLTRRLANDPDVEQAEVRAELAKIVALRLEKAFVS